MPTQRQRAVQVAYLIPDQFWSSSIVGSVEIFHGMELNSKAFQSSEFRGFEVTFLRPNRKKPVGFSGLTLDTQYFASASIKDKQFDAVAVPSVWNLSMENLTNGGNALTWLRQQHQNGAVIAGLVTGVFYLAEAGLLDGREATIHWASINIFKERYPHVKLTPQVQLIESDNIITTSSTPAMLDFALLLIQRFLGDRAAEYASHYFAIRDKNAPLPEFLEPTSHDTLVDAVRDKIRMSYAEALTLETLAIQFNITSRTLSRRFAAATGVGPIGYLNRHRLNIARRMLQSTDLQVQQIAEQTGFKSTTVFGRSFKQQHGVSPRELREKRA